MENLKKFLLSAMLLMFCVVMHAQQLEASGTVTDSKGEGIVGATVMEQGSSNGTVTDLDGNFKLSVKSGTMLTISYIGYQTITVKASPNMQLKMEENEKMLNEVVVTGYTTQRKADLTGAVAVVNVQELAKQNENNPIKALQGRVPGMNISADGSPSGGATVRIRGIGTLNDNDPL